VPVSTSLRAKADTVLRNIYLNDQYGDCVIAGRYHRIGLLTGAATGTAFMASQDMILKDYTAIGGFDPNNPTQTDNGCDMQTAANYGVTTGYADGSKDIGWLTVDGTDKAQVASAFYACEDLDFGMALPEAWVQNMPSKDGFVWDTAGDPVPSNGHCVVGVDLDKDGIIIDSWGLEGLLTWAAIAKYTAASAGGELYVHLNEDQLAKGATIAPDGIDWMQAIAFFNNMGGHVSVSKPAPSPLPDNEVTLAHLEACVDAALSGAPFAMLRARARTLVFNALKNSGLA
jgi:hypothetical protein